MRTKCRPFDCATLRSGWQSYGVVKSHGYEYPTLGTEQKHAEGGAHDGRLRLIVPHGPKSECGPPVFNLEASVGAAGVGLEGDLIRSQAQAHRLGSVDNFRRELARPPPRSGQTRSVGG